MSADSAPLFPREFEQGIRELVQQRRLGEASALVQEQLRIHPDQPDLLRLASDVCRAAGRHGAALAHAQRLIGVDPANWQGYLRTAQELVTLRRFEEAHATLEQGLAQIPDQITLLKYTAFVHAFLAGDGRIPTQGEREDYQFCLQDMIAYSADPEYFRIIRSRRPPVSQPAAPFAKQPLFVAGMPRSGTTALGQMLAISGEVEMYIELYPVYRLAGYRPDSFSAGLIEYRLRSHPHRERNLREWRTKHGHARFVGDKRPLFQFNLEVTCDNFAPAKVRTVYVHRDLHSICRSFHRRALAADDPWPLEQGIEHAIQIYNASCRQMLYLRQQRPDIFADIIFVDYKTIFSDLAAARCLFDRIGVVLREREQHQLAVFLESSAARIRGIAEPDALDREIEPLIARHLDQPVHRRFCAAAGVAAEP